ncbi:MAG: lipid-A-disaccharide synthase [Spirulina sp. DLM2.Bin59]|nr:MAG: lipid-A-disaccharide synthase [Spirulina sp. DLM2.Bin59]
MAQPLDILILSNGPGEVTTWVRPVLGELRRRYGEDRQRLRISVVLAPCNHATGNEAAVVRGYPECDRLQEPADFWPFLLWGKTAEGWDWRRAGIVLFLGGDQFFAVAIAKRLGYRLVVYAEWETRWPRWVDQFAVMNAAVGEKMPPAYRSKAYVVGDLMSDQPDGEGGPAQTEWIGFLPGSKAMKLTQGLPLAIAFAHHLAQRRPHTRIGIPLAPTLDLPSLCKFADPHFNPMMAVLGMGPITCVEPPQGNPYLRTATGETLEIWPDFPAHDHLRRCRLCITTVGANTAELAALQLPMVVILATHQIEAMQAWDGLPGLMARLPGLGIPLITAFNQFMYGQYRRRERQGQKPLFAWPNIWAGREIVPEWVGSLTGELLAQRIDDLLNDPAALGEMVAALKAVRGEPGAAAKLVAGLVEPDEGGEDRSPHGERGEG